MKAVLVIDVPADCVMCPCFCDETWRCCATEIDEEVHDGRPKWCPLRPLPKMIPYKGEVTRIKWHDIGYNNCIRELKGERWKMEGETE